MVDIRFEGDSEPVRPNFRRPNSKLTQLFIDKSFGLIKTRTQAAAVQLIVALVLLCIAAMLFGSNGQTNTVKSPSPDIINRPQPTRPLP
jgi:hypothetical protein